MPSATAVFNRTLTNLGPLTTTFTPGPSCTALASQSNAGFIFARSGYGNDLESANGPNFPYGSVVCTPQDLATCYPNGKERQSILATGYEFTQAYNSPGYHCPAGWTAVASATLPDVSSNRTVPSGYDAYATGFALSAMASGETMTMCCPSGYTPFAGDFEFQVGCTSSMGPTSSYGVSERCFNDRPTTTATFEYWSGEVTKIEPVSDAPAKYIQLPLQTGSLISYEIIHTMPNIVLINKGTATETASPTPTSTSKDEGKDGKKNSGSVQRVNLPFAAAVTILLAAGSLLGLG